MNMRHASCLLIICVFLSRTALSASQSVLLRLGDQVTLPAAGLTLRPFAGYINSPVQSATAYTYTDKRNGEKFEAHDPLELWRHEQIAAIFIGASGAVTVVKLIRDPPGDLPLVKNLHVKLADYEAAKTKRRTYWQDADRRAWVAGFTGLDIREAVSHIPGMYMHYPFARYYFQDKDNERYFGYTLKLPARGGANDFFFLFEFHDQYEIPNRQDMVYRFLRSVAPARPQRRTSNQRPDRRFQNTGNLSTRSNTAHAMTRDRVIQNIKNLADWWYVETPNYILTSNMSGENKQLVSTIQTNIEIIRKAYERLFPPVKPVKAVSVIRIFRRRLEYLNYVDQKMEWSGGVWLPDKKELVISPMANTPSRKDPSAILPVVYHEAFHQYIFHALDGKTLPIWMNEGHASFFEGSRVNTRIRRVQVTENKDRMAVLQDMLKHPDVIDLADIITMRASDFYVHDAGDGASGAMIRSRHYALAWALVYFIRKAAPVLYPYPRYERICDNAVRALAQGKSVEQAAQASLAGVNLTQMKKDFLDFWKYANKQKKAENYRLFR